MNESTYMNKNVPKLHQSHEITSSDINSFTFEDKKVKLAKTRRKIELLNENNAKIPNAPCLKSLCIMPLWSWFWRPSQCQNWAQDSSFESFAYLLSNPSWILEFECNFPLQKWFFPTLLPVCPKRGRKVFFRVFFTLLEAQNLSKSLGNG